MNEILHAYYRENPQYASRKNTDTFFPFGGARLSYGGIADRMARWVEEHQLLDASLWQLFVDQFRGCPDDGDAGWRCEYWGKMMRGGALTYQYTRSPALYRTLTDTVLDMLSAQDPLGRFSTYSVGAEFDGWDLWGRKYILLGMLHYHEICRDEGLRALIVEACRRHADYIIARIGPGEGQKNITAASRHWGGINSSSILEPMMRLYGETGDGRYLDFARYIVENGGSSRGNIFQCALEGERDPYRYPEKKAYELMSCFEGLLEYYRVTREPKWLVALRNFAYRLIKSDVTVIGCCGCTHELFDHSTHRQTFTGYEGIMQETCVTVTWMKLCLQMLCLTGDSAFADEMERSAFNALYGAVNTEERTENLGLPFDSYSPLLAGTRGRKVGGLKYMENDTAYYGCCACIGAAGTALFPLSNVLLSRTGIAVNFYLPGTAEIPTPAGQFCRLETQSDYPTGGAVTIRVGLVGPEAFTVSLRIPHFGEGTTVTVNGMPVPAAAGKYLHVARTWADGDEIRLEIPMTVRVRRGVKLEEDPASEHHICLTRGPLVLARDARIAGNTVGTPVRLCRGKDGSVTLTPAGRPAFPVQGAWSVETESGESVTLIDYASAGKTWNEDSRMECWLKTE